jgi:hypothetical protein
MGLFKYTYGYFELMKNDLRNSPYFRFNMVVQTRSVEEIQRRSDFLINTFKQELYGKESAATQMVYPKLIQPH